MLRTQLERGNNGLIKTKFLTFTVEAKDIRSARARLARIETDTLNHFKVIGAAARVLDGKQRLEVLHGIFHPDGERFNFAWEWLPASGLSVKDFIAPSSFRFGDGRMFQMGGKFGAVSFLQIVAPELSDRMLADFMDAENGIIVNLHIQSIDHNEAIPYVWGGSSPETSFDCSGFVSYVLTNSGLYNTGRLGAQGLYNISARVSAPKPGDLVFFTGTYDTPGVSHVGIYVGEDAAGNPVMLHCGDPIQYSKLNTSYWQSHFYAYGRLNYN